MNFRFTIYDLRWVSLTAGLWLALVGPLQAQPFAIDWFTVDGGGGASAGGTFTLSGSIGQPDAGGMSGGAFTVEGGFWSITAEAPPFLSVERVGGGVRVFWTLSGTGFVLDETTSLTGAPALAWTQVPFPYQTNATHISITVPLPAGQRFYRLRRP